MKIGGNVMTTDLWADGGTPPKVGLRIGIDGRGPLNADGWKPFYSGRPWLADEIKLDTGDLAVLVDGRVFTDILTSALAKNPPRTDKVWLEEPTVRLGDGRITVDVAARSGDIPLGCPSSEFLGQGAA